MAGNVKAFLFVAEFEIRPLALHNENTVIKLLLLLPFLFWFFFLLQFTLFCCFRDSIFSFYFW